jgi:integrase
MVGLYRLPWEGEVSMARNGEWERVEPYLYRLKHESSTGEWTTRYYVRFKDWKGASRSFPAGTGLRAARSKKKRILGENEQGVDFDKGKVERLTFNRWADRYLELTAAKRTARDDRLLVKVLRPEFGTLPLEEITYSRIKEFALKLRQTPGKIHPDRLQTPATCNRKLALLRHILRMAWKEGLIEKLPAVELFPEDNERDRVLTEEEFSRLYAEAAEHLQPILLCAWETGMRRGEILGLTWAKVNLHENLLTLESEDTKTKRRRIIPMNGRLREMLLALRQRKSKVTDIQQHVFLGETGKRVIYIQHSFKGAVTRAGLKDVHFHDLRRSFVTRKVTEGWDRDHVKAITGHRTDKVFARYNKPSLDTLRAVVEGTPSTAVVKLLSNGPGLTEAAVLSA